MNLFGKKSTRKSIKRKTAGIFGAFGISKERDYFVENLSMLVYGGMPIINALDSVTEELRSKRIKKIIAGIRADIEAGSPLWKTLGNSKLFPEHAVSLIRLGEESGNLTENLKIVAAEEEKNREFKSKLNSAMMYPMFVLSLTVIIGVGIAWFILPKLAVVFAQLKINLPLITKILIGVGVFLGKYGLIVVPSAIVITGLIFFFFFAFSRTKFIGQFMLFHLPGIKIVMREVEVARFGYLMGTLLNAGLPIIQVLDSLRSATEIAPYRNLYIHMRHDIEDGNSIQKSMASFKGSRRLIPEPIQQLIAAGEQSGKLSETLIKVGQSYEVKADTSTKNLEIILEPVMLVIVWLGVVAIAMAVILPIYSLIGGFDVNAHMSGSSNTSVPVVQPAPASVPAPIAPIPTPVPVSSATSTASAILTSKTMTKSAATAIAAKGISLTGSVPTATLTILTTELGYLNVRDTPASTGTAIGKVVPGDILPYVAENGGWYQIIVSDGTSGWVAGKYVTVNP